MSNYFQKIMIIDDDSLDRLLLKKEIEKAALADEIIETDMGYRAIDILTGAGEKQQEIPELIFLDVNMPAMNGFQFLDTLLQLSRDYGKRCRIVMICSVNDEAEKKRALEYHIVAGYYLKPLSAETLLGLKEILRHVIAS